MSLITRNNYEAFLLDYVEENLTPELTAELMLFLENNPELKEDLEDFEIHALVPQKVDPIDKRSLKKESNLITLSNYEDYFIREIEGVNSIEVSNAVELFIENNPEKRDELMAFQKTKLVAPVVSFEDKKGLKRKENNVIPMYWWYSSAAAVIIILFLLKGFTGSEEKNHSSIANKETIVVPEVRNEEVKVEQQVKEEVAPKQDVEQVAIQEGKTPPLQEKKKGIIVNTPEITPVEEEEFPVIMVNKEEKEIEKEVEEHPVYELDELPQEEEVLYADNVIITYEEEPVVSAVVEPRTRFNAIKEIFNQRVKNRILKQKKDENGEVVAYAVDIAGVGFSRNKRKNKK